MQKQFWNGVMCRGWRSVEVQAHKAWIPGKGPVVEIGMLKAILLGSQTDVRKLSLETGGKVILVIE